MFVLAKLISEEIGWKTEETKEVLLSGTSKIRPEIKTVLPKKWFISNKVSLHHVPLELNPLHCWWEKEPLPPRLKHQLADYASCKYYLSNSKIYPSVVLLFIKGRPRPAVKMKTSNPIKNLYLHLQTHKLTRKDSGKRAAEEWDH